VKSDCFAKGLDLVELLPNVTPGDMAFFWVSKNSMSRFLDSYEVFWVDLLHTFFLFPGYFVFVAIGVMTMAANDQLAHRNKQRSSAIYQNLHHCFLIPAGTGFILVRLVGKPGFAVISIPFRIDQKITS
jgi:hypothetical protein